MPKMIPNKRNQKDKHTTAVDGDFPVHWLHTAGDVNEKFFYGLRDQKMIANKCASCDYTYLPPRMFCEDCFEELGDDTYTELSANGELFSFSEVFIDKEGNKYDTPVMMGLIKVEGASTTFYHKLLNIAEPSVGMKLKAVWAENREGSLLDLAGFEAL